MGDTIIDELRGRRALVTGASRGTGAAIVARLRAAGADVLGTARTPPRGASDDGFVAADATTPEGTAMIVEQARERFSVLDILVHTLGGTHAPAGGFAALTDEHWQAELALNLLPAVRLDRALPPPMREAGRDAVVHVRSIQRRLPLFDPALGYAAAKAALTTDSKGLAKELAPQGIRANVVSPGAVRTQGAEALTARIARRHRVDHTTAWQMITESLGGIHSAAPPNPPRSPNWWPFWYPTEPAP